MKREIKFRGKNDYGKWEYGDLIQYENGNKAIVSKKFTKYGYEATELYKRTKVLSDSVGQFTGMQDKKKVDIYDKDIIRVNNGKTQFNVIVKWSDDACAFMVCFCDKNQAPLSWFSNLLSETHEIEIIGNIFDNPELMEK